MTTHSYTLPVPPGEASWLARGWLLLAVGALVLSGLFAVLIVLSRAPWVSDFFPWVDFFHVALVVHVDLSVLVWFLAFAGIFWSLNSTHGHPLAGRVALSLATLGTLIMCAAPFLGASHPVIANYVPVLDHWMFLAGLSIFGLGFLVSVIYAIVSRERIGREVSATGALRFGLDTAMVAAVMTFVALLWSWSGIPDFVTGKEYYETLFWGGGHVLQFMHAQLMLVTWLWLASITGAPPSITPRAIVLLLALGVVFVFAAPVVYLIHDVHSIEHRMTFTWIMAIGGGLAPLPIGLAVAWSMFAAGRGSIPAGTHPERAALIFSMILFGVGGVLGFMITGSNTIVPAHYHGSIVGITMAFMGLTYHLLPRLGFVGVPPRMAMIQPYVFGGGQLLHVLGLAWSGGHGVQRKTAGSAQGLENLPEILGMALVGIGGLVAVAGGVMFLIIVFRSVMPVLAGRKA